MYQCHGSINGLIDSASTNYGNIEVTRRLGCIAMIKEGIYVHPSEGLPCEKVGCLSENLIQILKGDHYRHG